MSSFHKSLEVKRSLISNLILSLAQSHTPPSSPQQCTPSKTTKHSLSLSLESFLPVTPIFTSIATKHSFLPHFLRFTYLIALLSWYKLKKILTSFESPYMICTCCVIWLEVQVVEYRHIRILFLFAILLKWPSFWILEQIQHVLFIKFWKITSNFFWLLESTFWDTKLKFYYRKCFLELIIMCSEKYIREWCLNFCIKKIIFGI